MTIEGKVAKDFPVESVAIGRFVFLISSSPEGTVGAPFVIKEKGDPDWSFTVGSAEAVQAFLRGVMIGTERHF